MAFRVQPDRATYDCFYLRPTNGRADDQERRNHTAQPTLIVNDVKSGPAARGMVALWFEGSTIAHFANLRITPR